MLKDVEDELQRKVKVFTYITISAKYMLFVYSSTSKYPVYIYFRALGVGRVSSEIQRLSWR